MIEDLGMDIDVGKIKGRYITKKGFSRSRHIHTCVWFVCLICMYVYVCICMYVDRPAAAEAEEKKEVEKTPFEYVAATIDATGVTIITCIHTCIHTVYVYIHTYIHYCIYNFV